MIDSNFHITESEKKWHNMLNDFYQEIDLTRRASIRELVEKTDLSLS